MPTVLRNPDPGLIISGSRIRHGFGEIFLHYLQNYCSVIFTKLSYDENLLLETKSNQKKGGFNNFAALTFMYR
jgi:hypothetical protein